MSVDDIAVDRVSKGRRERLSERRKCFVEVSKRLRFRRIKNLGEYAWRIGVVMDSKPVVEILCMR